MSTNTDTPETKARDMQTLNPEQRARVAALRAANGALAATGFASRQAVDPVDLVNIAEYIITGQDPWEAAIGRVVDSAAETAATALGDVLGGTTRVDSDDA